MDLSQRFPKGYIVEAEHETSSAQKNPEEWKIRGTIKVDLGGATLQDILNDAISSIKIKRQGTVRMLTRTEAQAKLSETVVYADIGKRGPRDPKAAYRNKLLLMSKEERLRELQEMMEEFED